MIIDVVFSGAYFTITTSDGELYDSSQTIAKLFNMPTSVYNQLLVDKVIQHKHFEMYPQEYTNADLIFKSKGISKETYIKRFKEVFVDKVTALVLGGMWYANNIESALFGNSLFSIFFNEKVYITTEEISKLLGLSISQYSKILTTQVFKHDSYFIEKFPLSNFKTSYFEFDLEDIAPETYIKRFENAFARELTFLVLGGEEQYQQ